MGHWAVLDQHHHLTADHSDHGSSSGLCWPQVDEVVLSLRGSGQVAAALVVLGTSSPDSAAPDLLPRAHASSFQLDAAADSSREFHGLSALGLLARAPSSLGLSPSRARDPGRVVSAEALEGVKEPTFEMVDSVEEAVCCTGVEQEVLVSSRLWRGCDFQMAENDAGSEERAVEVAAHGEVARAHLV